MSGPKIKTFSLQWDCVNIKNTVNVLIAFLAFLWKSTNVSTMANISNLSKMLTNNYKCKRDQKLNLQLNYD